MTTNPQGPSRQSGDHRSMTEDPDLDAFNKRLATWLDDEQATGLPEAETMYHAGSAYGSMQRAIHEASGPGHEACPVDRRTYDIILMVVGTDGVRTLQRLEPGVSPGCVLRALRQDRTVAVITVMGMEDRSPKPEPGSKPRGYLVSGSMTDTPAAEPKHARRPWWRRLLGQ